MRSTSPKQTSLLTIGELSRRTGVNIETILYYERINMLPAPRRTASGRRVYGSGDRRTLAFIRRARELGFTLSEIRALLALSAECGRESCAEVRDLAAAHLAESVERSQTSRQWSVSWRMRCGAAMQARRPDAQCSTPSPRRDSNAPA